MCYRRKTRFLLSSRAGMRRSRGRNMLLPGFKKDMTWVLWLVHNLQEEDLQFLGDDATQTLSNSWHLKFHFLVPVECNPDVRTRCNSGWSIGKNLGGSATGKRRRSAASVCCRTTPSTCWDMWSASSILQHPPASSSNLSQRLFFIASPRFEVPMVGGFLIVGLRPGTASTQPKEILLEAGETETIWSTWSCERSSERNVSSLSL